MGHKPRGCGCIWRGAQGQELQPLRHKRHRQRERLADMQLMHKPVSLRASMTTPFSMSLGPSSRRKGRPLSSLHGYQSAPIHELQHTCTQVALQPHCAQSMYTVQPQVMLDLMQQRHEDGFGRLPTC